MEQAEDVFHLGIKGLIRNAEGEILLLQINRQKLDQATEAYWDIPGGRMQRGETPLDALRREIQEETGITSLTNIQPLVMSLSNIRIPQKNGTDVGLVLWVFTCDAPALDQIAISDEHVALAWFSPAEAAEKLRVKFADECIEKIAQLA
jgi:mutator protein MutT